MRRIRISHFVDDKILSPCSNLLRKISVLVKTLYSGIRQIIVRGLSACRKASKREKDDAVRKADISASRKTDTCVPEVAVGGHVRRLQAVGKAAASVGRSVV
jgi:hypothetical protein